MAQAAEIRWWRLYLRSRVKEDYLTRKRHYWARVLDAAGVRIEPGMEVLDAGCGPAGIFIHLESCRVTALDPLLDAYQAGLPHFHPADYPWARFVNRQLEAYEPESPFGLVCCLNAINHVADLPRCLDVLTRSLRPEGKMLLGVDVHRYGLLKTLFRILPGDILHPQQHDLQDYRAMLEARGLQVERCVRLKKGRIFHYQVLVASRASAR